jgi:hypothetical protein
LVDYDTACLALSAHSFVDNIPTDYRVSVLKSMDERKGENAMEEEIEKEKYVGISFTPNQQKV